MIEVMFGGATFRCSTVEETVTLALALGAIPSAPDPLPPKLPEPSSAAEPAAAPWRQPMALDLYWGRLDPLGREAIRTIATSQGGVSGDELRERLGLTSRNDVSAVLAGCKRKAAAVGISDYRDVFTCTITGARATRGTLYFPGHLLREAELPESAGTAQGEEGGAQEELATEGEEGAPEERSAEGGDGRS